jgi:hypothetical protein
MGTQRAVWVRLGSASAERNMKHSSYRRVKTLNRKPSATSITMAETGAPDGLFGVGEFER